MIFLASSNIVDSSPMCVCPCNPTATRSETTSLPSYHSASSGIITSNTLEKSSPLFYILTTTSTSTTNVSPSLSSSVCYCPYSTTSSASYLLWKYAYRKRLAYSQFFARELKWKNAIRFPILRAMWTKNCRILPFIRLIPHKGYVFIFSSIREYLSKFYPEYFTFCKWFKSVHPVR